MWCRPVIPAPQTSLDWTILFQKIKSEKAGQAWVMVPTCNPTSEDRQMNCSDLQPAQTSAEIPLISPLTPHTEKNHLQSLVVGSCNFRAVVLNCGDTLCSNKTYLKVRGWRWGNGDTHLWTQHFGSHAFDSSTWEVQAFNPRAREMETGL